MLFASPVEGLRRLDFVAKEWLGLLVNWMTGRSDALLPGSLARSRGSQRSELPPGIGGRKEVADRLGGRRVFQQRRMALVGHADGRHGGVPPTHLVDCLRP